MYAQPYEIGHTWSSSENTDVQLNVYVGNKHFQVDLCTANFEASPRLLKEYLLHVKHSDPENMLPLSDDDGDDDDETDPLEVFYSWAMKPFLPLFRQIPPLDSNRQYTLQECLFPERLLYTLQVVDDELTPVKLQTILNNRPLGVLLPRSKEHLSSIFPIFRPNDIYIPLIQSAAALPTRLGKVYVGKERDIYFFKQLQAGDVSMTVTELSTYAKINSARFEEDVKISRIFGVVKDEETSRLLGFLLSYIECGTHGGPLGCEPRRLTDVLLCRKWLKQITYSLHELHRHQITWGDAKPENILVDEQDDAYLIDFGGGYTNGWVNKELANTIEGDMQGLERIAEFLTPSQLSNSLDDWSR